MKKPKYETKRTTIAIRDSGVVYIYCYECDRYYDITEKAVCNMIHAKILKRTDNKHNVVYGKNNEIIGPIYLHTNKK